VSRSFNARALSRREFTVESVLALLAGVTITIAGCGGSDGPTSPSTNTSGGGTTTTTTQQDVNGVISANHGHVATVTAARITAAQAFSLDIQGNATHNHTVQLSSDQLRAIAARQQVVVTSSTDVGHDHTVTFN